MKTSELVVHPSAVVRSHRHASSSQRASRTSALNRMCGANSYLSTQCCMYCLISGCRAQVRVQSSFCSKVNEYRREGVSQHRPGYRLFAQVPPTLVDLSRMTKSSNRSEEEPSELQ